MLEIKDLDVKVKNEDKVILNKLSLNINKGEVHVIMGPNGTGKSTLISKIIETINTGGNIAVTSPTHKANSVLRKMLLNVGITKEDALISTIHSFLGLKLQNEKNRQVLKHGTVARQNISV